MTYTADPGTNGEVTISAAAGATFGSTTVVVNCPFGATAGANTAVAGAAGFGCPAGVAACIRPPNTGDAGLARLTQPVS